MLRSSSEAWGGLGVEGVIFTGDLVCFFDILWFNVCFLLYLSGLTLV